MRRFTAPILLATFVLLAGCTETRTATPGTSLEVFPSPTTLAAPTMTVMPAPQYTSTPIETAIVLSATPEAASFVFDPVPTLDGLTAKVQKITPAFYGTFEDSTNFNSVPLAIADTNNDGHNEIIVGLTRRVGPKPGDLCLTWRDPDCSNIFQWNGSAYQSLPSRWILPKDWKLSCADDDECVELADIGHVFASDLTGDDQTEIIVGLTPSRATYLPGLFVLQFDQATSRYKSTTITLPKSIVNAPISFEVVPGESPPSLLMAETIENGIINNPSVTNNVSLLRQVEGKWQWQSLLDDRSDMLYAGYLPGHADYYVLREKIYDLQHTQTANLIQAYKLIGSRLIPTGNPLPVENNVEQLIVARLPGEAQSDIILLRADPRCKYADYLDGGCPDEILTDLEDAIELYRPEGNGYRLLSTIKVDPDFHSVKRLIVGDLDNDGYDEILTSTGIVYKWHDSQFYVSDVIQKAAEGQWETCYCPVELAGVIGDANNDGKNEIVLLAPTQLSIPAGNENMASVFVIQVNGP